MLALLHCLVGWHVVTYTQGCELRVQPPVGACMGDDWSIFFSDIDVSLSLPSPLSKINKHVLGWGICMYIWCSLMATTFLEWILRRNITWRTLTHITKLFSRRIRTIYRFVGRVTTRLYQYSVIIILKSYCWFDRWRNTFLYSYYQLQFFFELSHLNVEASVFF